MSDKTVLNPEISEEPDAVKEPLTVLNTAAQDGTPDTSAPETQVNTELYQAAGAIPDGTLLSGRYKVISPLGTSAGEANHYICGYEDKKYVVKVYRRQRAVKPEVTAILKSIDSPYVAKLYDTGVFNGCPYEVLPYYKNGSLQGRLFTLEELKKTVIPGINEALRALHEKDVIHKDLKPSNIMSTDNGGIAVIDFGISSVIEEGNTVLLTKTGMTPEYSAPETFKNLFLEESDYYSFGITLFELFCGHTPYKDLDADQIARYTAVQRILFPENMPAELRELIAGTTYFDITNRNNKSNPNRRWTYKEVSDWCKGIKQTVPGEGTGAGADRAVIPYTFSGKVYKDVLSLMGALAGDWNNGKKQLFGGYLTEYFGKFDPTLAGYCAAAEAESTRCAGKDDIIFRNLIYKIHPGLKTVYWMGQSYESMPVLGRDILERLWKNDRTNCAYWDSILDGGMLSGYLKGIGSKNEELCAAVTSLEAQHGVPGRSERDKTIDYYSAAYLLSGQKLLYIDGKKLKNVQELSGYMKQTLDSSYKKFESLCHRLIDYDGVLDVQLEAWLIALGKRGELDVWRDGLR